ncbi:MarR family transcriptional regulator [Actinophytocola sp.]|uniref:MarR family transcriptional regulator n=1 Tax=Actinophytocola sp. TaxID=1872138 RepID=UPI003D6B08B2
MTTFLARDRPLGAARLLWEIGSGDGTDVRELRARLDLDSGYVSRLPRSLEADGLVTVTASTGDRRVRVACSPPRAGASVPCSTSARGRRRPHCSNRSAPSSGPG